MIKAVIFDLDGTLLDSLPDIANAINYTLRKYNLPEHNIDTIKQFVGNGFRALLEKALPKGFDDIKTLDKMEIDGRAYYRQNSCNISTLYDGISEMLDLLRDRKIILNINTNKPHINVEPIVNYFYNKWYFKETIGQKKELPLKPDPHIALSIVESNNLSCDEFVFVGDSEIDVLTARNAGIKSIAVTWGFNSRDFLIGHNPDFIVDYPLEVVDIIDQINSNKII